MQIGLCHVEIFLYVLSLHAPRYHKKIHVQLKSCCLEGSPAGSLCVELCASVSVHHEKAKVLHHCYPCWNQRKHWKTP